jgi:hypothetical protein
MGGFDYVSIGIDHTRCLGDCHELDPPTIVDTVNAC